MKAEEIGFPVAVKLVSPQALHKTEVGGVALGLRSAAEVRDGAAAMARRFRAQQPGAAVEGFLVQEMVAGLELIVGVREDPQLRAVHGGGTGRRAGRGAAGRGDPPPAGR